MNPKGQATIPKALNKSKEIIKAVAAISDRGVMNAYSGTPSKMGSYSGPITPRGGILIVLLNLTRQLKPPQVLAKEANEL